VLAATFNMMIERIRDAQATLLRQERLAVLGQLTATVSHEIRNPLGTIRTSIFLIGQATRGKALGIEAGLARIHRSVDRCDRIITDLLDYSRVRPLRPQDTDVDAWLAALLDEQEDRPQVELIRQLSAGVSVPLDRERFRRCIVNLLTNACQAMEPGGGQLTVATGCQDGRVLVHVCDTGCGIPPDQLEKVFEPLYSTKSFGVGLGLTIVRQVVQQHQGGMTVASEPGRGTTFTVWLPLHAPTPDDSADHLTNHEGAHE
jgi:signal transduction histidine kinase